MIARRKMICGMHVHVAVPDRVSRVDLMVRSLPYVPLVLALSTSSPFWHSHRTGLMGYRQALHAELPRSGLPDLFRGEADYDAYVAALIDNRIIADASFIWWVVRPSSTYSTLELRVADSCTHVEDAVAIAALFRCLVRRLTRDPDLNRGLTPAARAIIEENKWRAQRYGIHGSLIDLVAGEARPIALVLSDVMALVAEDAAALGCEAELSSLTRILERGTSADQQLGVYRDALAGGASQPEALGSVVGWLAETTVH
jgi:carboxylate-amine ligase